MVGQCPWSWILRSSQPHRVSSGGQCPVHAGVLLVGQCVTRGSAEGRTASHERMLMISGTHGSVAG